MYGALRKSGRQACQIRRIVRFSIVPVPRKPDTETMTRGGAVVFCPLPIVPSRTNPLRCATTGVLVPRFDIELRWINPGLCTGPGPI